MLRLLEIFGVGLIIIIICTDIIYPILTNKPLFGSFRKTPPIIPEVEKEIDPSTLDGKIEVAKVKVGEVKDIQSEVSAHFKTAEQLKKDSDNLLK